MAGEITIQQLMQTPVITRVVSRIRNPLSLFQNFFGMLHEEIFRTRPLGQQFGVVDLNGQSYVNQQISYLTQRFRNSREFMISRMLRGGFGVLQSGESWIPVEKGAGTFDVDYNLPATHLSQLDLGTGSDIIGTTWLSAGADVVGDVLGINKAFERLHGRALRHIWINSTLFGSLLSNTGLQAVGGTAYRIFDSLSARQQKSVEGIPDTGFDVVFRALPLQTFHVYDGVLNVNQLTDSDSTANTSMFIPDQNAIFMPEPSPDWVGWINASEYVKENLMDAGNQVFGFHSWTTNVIDPAGVELKMLDNGLPVLYVPKSIAYGTVVF